MDNQNTDNKVNEAFDEIILADEAEQPIEELLANPIINNEKENEESKPVSEPPSYTPKSSHGYIPTGSYSNQNGSKDGTVYITKPPKANNPKKANDKEKKKMGITPFGFIAVILVVAIVSAAISVGIIFALGLVNKNVPPISQISDALSTENGKVESVVESIYEKVSPSIVGIRTTVGVKNFLSGIEQDTGEGTGIIYSSDGYIITCYHVIEEIYGSNVTSAKIEVFLTDDADKGIEAEIIGFNKPADIALIKIDKNKLKPADFGTSEDVKVGQFAVAIGNPGGLQFMSSVSYGVISGINRSVSVEGLGEMSLIQTDAAINPGNSGGALVNTEGKVIAMNSSKYVSEGYEGLGFAIPIDTVLEIIDYIFENKDIPKPYIGVEYYTTITSEWLEENGFPTGIVIQNVVPGSPAEYANLISGDIIVEFDGKKIKDAEDYVEILAKCEPGEKVSFKIFRSRYGVYYQGNITIGSSNVIMQYE